MRPDEVAAAIRADPRLIIPVGTCEQHGPHLPLGCDTIIVERLADDLSAEFGVLRAPTLEYGVNNLDAEVVWGGSQGATTVVPGGTLTLTRNQANNNILPPGSPGFLLLRNESQMGAPTFPEAPHEEPPPLSDGCPRCPPQASTVLAAAPPTLQVREARAMAGSFPSPAPASSAWSSATG